MLSDRPRDAARLNYESAPRGLGDLCENSQALDRLGQRTVPSRGWNTVYQAIKGSRSACRSVRLESQGFAAMQQIV